MKIFFVQFSVYSCHLFSISSASVRAILFLSFIVPIFPWNVPLASLIFLKRSLVFPILWLSSIFLHWSLRKAFLSFLAILWNSAFRWEYLSFSLLPLLSLLFSATLRPPQTTILPFFISFSREWSWSPPLVQYYEPPSIVLHALCLWDLIPWIYLFLPLYNCKGFDLGHTEWASGFPYLLQFTSEFGNKGFRIWATVNCQSCFCWLYRASPSLATKNIINLIVVLIIWWCPCVEFSLCCWKRVFAMTSVFSW